MTLCHSAAERKSNLESGSATHIDRFVGLPRHSWERSVTGIRLGAPPKSLINVREAGRPCHSGTQGRSSRSNTSSASYFSASLGMRSGGTFGYKCPISPLSVRPPSVSTAVRADYRWMEALDASGWGGLTDVLRMNGLGFVRGLLNKWSGCLFCAACPVLVGRGSLECCVVQKYYCSSQLLTPPTP